ncbi:hypothetical protein [Actinomycetia phage DSL-LC01]|nr:hypothetical protein [Actinomycetia phage DSL-LC01]
METTITRKSAVLLAVDQLIDFMNEANKRHHAEKFPTLTPDTYELVGGRKYLKIAEVSQYGGRSVHCFVDAETGGVYKAAGWKAPALNGERYNLLDPKSFEELKRRWDPYTSYLYK